MPEARRVGVQTDSATAVNLKRRGLQSYLALWMPGGAVRHHWLSPYCVCECRPEPYARTIQLTQTITPDGALSQPSALCLLILALTGYR